MLYKNLAGCTLQDAKKFAKENNIKAVFVETKDRYNDYENKRIIRVKKIDGDETIEFLYAGFPPYKE